MKISIISPVKNEVDFVGYSVMAVLPYIHEILYGVADCDDGTQELLLHIKKKYAGDKLRIFEDLGSAQEMGLWNFNPRDTKAYNESFNYLIRQSTGDACWFLHPDMIVTNPEAIQSAPDAQALYTNVTSYAKDFETVITKGRCSKWKNIHKNTFGLHYFGGYGSTNEDFYHSAITGRSYRHYGDDFKRYPFVVKDSGINVNHYCELKPYSRRLEKMKLCLKTQNPDVPDGWIEEKATHHPRVTLEPTNDSFGVFKFEKHESTKRPDVFEKYEAEFSEFKKSLATV